MDYLEFCQVPRLALLNFNPVRGQWRGPPEGRDEKRSDRPP
jgi:hypothetical protein